MCTMKEPMLTHTGGVFVIEKIWINLFDIIKKKNIYSEKVSQDLPQSKYNF